MMQYLIILLDDTSTSYCHYTNVGTKHRLISLSDLREGVMYAMLENLMVQFVWPDNELPSEYIDVIESIDHNNIAPANFLPKNQKTDIAVFDKWRDLIGYGFDNETAYVLRIAKDELFANAKSIATTFRGISRLSIIVTDVLDFTETDLERYRSVLDILSKEVLEIYKTGSTMQQNLLTDRIFLQDMNNCNAGCNNITLAPDGRFYICPAFYHAQENEYDGTGIAKTSVGDLRTGLHIENQYLFKKDYSPICRICDAYQCKRCLWLNRKMTNEINIPSHEQCVMAHVERDASRKLLNEIRKWGAFMPETEIAEENYADPFEIIIKNKY